MTVADAPLERSAALGGRPAVHDRPVPSPGRPSQRHTSGPVPPPRRRVDHRPLVGPRPPKGRVRRFVRRYGWRAYAIPLLTVATLATLVDLVLTGPAPASTPTTGSDAAAFSALTAPEPAEPTPAHVSALAGGDAGPSGTQVTTAAYIQQGSGTVGVVDGTSPVYGTGPLERFLVEVEDGTGVDGTAFAQAVEATLGDLRSWGNGGRLSFQRVGLAAAQTGQYEFRVSLVSPGSMEIYCPGAGTGGYTSCRYGERAVINLARWETAVPEYQSDIGTYRQYVVNHEVGHALGQGHQQCPGPGRLAPVMQQQTLGLNGCAKNPWPYP